MKEHVLAYDLSNIAFIATALAPKGFEFRPDAHEIAYNAIRQFARILFKHIMPDRSIFACDSSPYWRNHIFPDYKANRQGSLLKDCVREGIALFQQRHQHLCIKVTDSEADDIIYRMAEFGFDKLTIASMDSDLHQLSNDNIAIFNPKAKQYAKPPKHPKFDLFVKCIRGDNCDNIPSAYPYVTKKRLHRAFQDTKAMDHLLQTVMPNGEVVRDRYHFNRRLIDLSQSPKTLQINIDQSIACALS